MSRLEVGSTAPAFTLENQDGKKVSRKDFAGRRFVIYFYPADDTPGCTKEACQFNEGLTRFRQLAVNVLGVSPDGAAKHVAFRAKYALTFDLLSDPDRSVMESYGAFGEKMMYGKKVRGSSDRPSSLVRRAASNTRGTACVLTVTSPRCSASSAPSARACRAEHLGPGPSGTAARRPR